MLNFRQVQLKKRRQVHFSGGLVIPVMLSSEFCAVHLRKPAAGGEIPDAGACSAQGRFIARGAERRRKTCPAQPDLPGGNLSANFPCSGGRSSRNSIRC